MSNYHLQPAEKPQALTPQALRSLRQDPVQGISRRTLLRRSIGGAFLLWLTEVTAGSIGFLWPNVKGGFGSVIKIGKIDEIKAANTGIPFSQGFPAYFQAARAYDAGCAYALAGQPDDALRMLEEAGKAGAIRGDTAQWDPELVSLRNDPRFVAWIQRLRKPPRG